MFQGETSCHPGHRTWDPERKRTSGKLTDCSFYLIHPFPELQIPYLHFFLLMKKAGLQRDGRRSVRIQTRCLLRSPANLNKAPTEIQSCLCLSVLVVTGGMNIGFLGFTLTAGSYTQTGIWPKYTMPETWVGSLKRRWVSSFSLRAGS